MAKMAGSLMDVYIYIVSLIKISKNGAKIYSFVKHNKQNLTYDTG